ncbi:Swi5 complex subunit Swi2 [Schizosaccharomyces japonicus yFS275]|uniref:Swi5 complex subunit Swi2 n=1 Tax=Schizosaccharomyces japonicus (strain yFS275 / FY16936) TaxID=402676 RepID=B6JY36_SCHJY|nr:Swi5 complex subunit Swi2 [Schizosaccharomyces japonicus yFS275]EEB06454.1 Swi5 complex subunit Swi2 [Schizosaccharomyces japonicus yFS275]
MEDNRASPPNTVLKDMVVKQNDSNRVPPHASNENSLSTSQPLPLPVPKRKRGRPRKQANSVPQGNPSNVKVAELNEPVKRKRGRPRKNPLIPNAATSSIHSATVMNPEPSTVVNNSSEVSASVSTDAMERAFLKRRKGRPSKQDMLVRKILSLAADSLVNNTDPNYSDLYLTEKAPHASKKKDALPKDVPSLDDSNTLGIDDKSITSQACAVPALGSEMNNSSSKMASSKPQRRRRKHSNFLSPFSSILSTKAPSTSTSPFHFSFPQLPERKRGRRSREEQLLRNFGFVTRFDLAHIKSGTFFDTVLISNSKETKDCRLSDDSAGPCNNQTPSTSITSAVRSQNTSSTTAPDSRRSFEEEYDSFDDSQINLDVLERIEQDVHLKEHKNSTNGHNSRPNPILHDASSESPPPLSSQPYNFPECLSSESPKSPVLSASPSFYTRSNNSATSPTSANDAHEEQLPFSSPLKSSTVSNQITDGRVLASSPIMETFRIHHADSARPTPSNSTYHSGKLNSPSFSATTDEVSKTEPAAKLINCMSGLRSIRNKKLSKRSLTKPFKSPLLSSNKFLHQRRKENNFLRVTQRNDPLIQKEAELERDIAELNHKLETVRMALKAEAGGLDTNSIASKIQCWRNAARLAIEVLFPVFSLRFSTMMQEVPVSVIPNVVDELREKPCTIGTFLRQLDIPFHLVGYNSESNCWDD